MTSDTKREKVTEAMQLAVLWPLVPCAVLFLLPLVVFLAPVALVGVAAYLALAIPMWKASRALGNGIVSGTTTLSEKTVDSIAARTHAITEHKALTAKKEE